MTALSLIRSTLLVSALALAGPVIAAADPTMHEVYLAAEAGKFTEAQAMMDKVLKDHPNSAKAHFVEAELLAKQGKMSAAGAELSNAERLAPGLPFAKAGAVEKLRTLISSPAPAARPSYVQQARPAQSAPARDNGLPWGTLLIFGAGLAGFIYLATRFMSRRQAQEYGPAGMPGYAPGAPQGYAPAQGYGPAAGYGQGGMMGGQPAQGSGLGSRIAGGLATGAALGAGMVAGEALARHFTDGNGNRDHDRARDDIVYDQPPARDERLSSDDMGGTDFGVSDNSSWDDNSGGGGGDDW